MTMMMMTLLQWQLTSLLSYYLLTQYHSHNM